MVYSTYTMLDELNICKTLYCKSVQLKHVISCLDCDTSMIRGISCIDDEFWCFAERFSFQGAVCLMHAQLIVCANGLSSGNSCEPDLVFFVFVNELSVCCVHALFLSQLLNQK